FSRDWSSDVCSSDLARNILMGADDATTNYLQNTTSNALYSKFSPVVNSSLSRVGADKVWSEIINKYNSIPLVSKVNPDLTDYVKIGRASCRERIYES